MPPPVSRDTPWGLHSVWFGVHLKAGRGAIIKDARPVLRTDHWGPSFSCTDTALKVACKAQKLRIHIPGGAALPSDATSCEWASAFQV